jgi:outer membrane protein TolC
MFSSEMPIVEKRSTDSRARAGNWRGNSRELPALEAAFSTPKHGMTHITSLLARQLLLGVVLAGCLAGCSQHHAFITESKQTKETDRQLLKQVSYEESDKITTESSQCATPAPFALNADSAAVSYWDLSLDGAIQIALANSTVLRDLGARIIQAPQLTSTVYNPSVESTDPRFGEEAALSAFDAQLASRVFYEKNDRILNNSLLGGGTNFFIQDLWTIQNELTKKAATGTTFVLRHNIQDDFNNSPNNIFGSAVPANEQAWTWNFEAEVRQPLLKGAGVAYNRIAGPDATPGVYNGVVIARINTQISTTDFQLALRDYLSNVENAYWELVFAYRDLDAKKLARDRGLETWQRLKELNAQGVEGAEIDKVAQAAEQYFRFKQEVENALSGRLVDGTRDFNGSTGGTFQGVGGVYVAERRLRLIMGASINDGRLIRPTTEPVQAEIVMSWDEITKGALVQRAELVQQRLRIRRRNLELTASENFIKPELDMVGRYRFNGFSNHLYYPHFDIINQPLAPDQAVDSDKNEWQIGMELNMPIGFRQGYAGVRNAQLTLARERAVLTDMERQVVHDVSNAVSEKARSFQQVQTAYDRRTSALQQFTVLNDEAVRNTVRSKRLDFNQLLDAERRLADAESDYHRAVVGYAVAVKNVYVETGSLMEYCNVHYTDKDNEELKKRG